MAIEPQAVLAQTQTGLDSIRTTTRWIVGSFAAVGAALIAGSQLSDIGGLQPGPRLWLAILGAMAGLLGIAVSVWFAANVLTASQTTIAELAHPDAHRDRDLRAAVAFVEDNPELFDRIAPSIVELRERFKEETQLLWKAIDHQRANPSDSAAEFDAKAQAQRWSAIDRAVNRVITVANYERVLCRFRRARWKLLAAATLSAGGIVLFVWAANPMGGVTPASLRGADLRGANLTGSNLVQADLTDADLRRANLRGANLEGAQVTNVKWGKTTCPDGTSSDDARGTCEGHLRP